MTCKICKDEVYFLNVLTGEWSMCPRCLLLRDADAVRKAEGKENEGVLC